MVPEQKVIKIRIIYHSELDLSRTSGIPTTVWFLEKKNTIHWGVALASDGLKWSEMIGRVDSYLAESKALLDF
jgi:putative exporter of polyketide antibiotics